MLLIEVLKDYTHPGEGLRLWMGTAIYLFSYAGVVNDEKSKQTSCQMGR